MIKYLSTRDNTHTITSSQAIINGLAEDGGLYIPENLEDLKLDYHEVIQQDYPGMAETVFGKSSRILMRKRLRRLFPEATPESFRQKKSPAG